MLRICSLLAILASGSLARAADWPQWLGPKRDATSVEKVAPWKVAPRVLWRQPVGEGHSSPVVADGKVFIHAKVADRDEEKVAAFDAASGKPLWHVDYPRGEFSSVFGNGPHATPAVVDGRVYTLGVTGILSCFNADKGDKVWQVDTLTKFKAAKLKFGVSCSPLVDDNNVLVNVGGKGASIVAFDKASGEVAWKALDDPASYSSPIVFGAGKQRQVVFVTQQGVVSLSPNTGAVFWKFPMVDLLNESASTPVRLGDMLLAGSVTFGSVGLELSANHDQPAATKVWKNTALTCYFSTPVPADKQHVYTVTGTFVPPPEATLRCIDIKTGKESWRKTHVGRYHATLIRTGNDKILMLDDFGNLLLLDPAAEAYHELARSKVCGETWAHPALANGRLYIRDEKELMCLQLASQPEPDK